MTGDDRADALAQLEREVVNCTRCPRLVAWRSEVAIARRASFRDEDYWGRPVPGWGDPRARLLIVGLAPAAHGGNRTGRVFTGDRSGDWLFRALYECGFANQPVSVSRDDGLQLHDVYVAAAVRCAPPANRPTPAERDACEPFLRREYTLLEDVQAVVALGQFAYQSVRRIDPFRERHAFAHGAEIPLASGRTLVCSYHPSQQNTFTGRLTRDMLDHIFRRAREIILAGGT